MRASLPATSGSGIRFQASGRSANVGRIDTSCITCLTLGAVAVSSTRNAELNGPRTRRRVNHQGVERCHHVRRRSECFGGIRAADPNRWHSCCARGDQSGRCILDDDAAIWRDTQSASRGEISLGVWLTMTNRVDRTTAVRRHVASTHAAESTRTPSRSNTTASHSIVTSEIEFTPDHTAHTRALRQDVTRALQQW